MNAYEVLNIAPNATRDEIRAAYRELARRWHPDRFMAGPERGMYHSARRKLMGMSTRCAAWNYLFGWILMHNDEVEKALIYLSVAAHQKPECAQYALALKKAQDMTVSASRLSRLLSRVRG